MLAVRSLEASTEKYFRNCIRAYFEGTRNLRWILGVIGGAQDQARGTVETQFIRHEDTEKYRELMARL
jgi:uncharacterized protein YkwD